VEVVMTDGGQFEHNSVFDSEVTIGPVGGGDVVLSEFFNSILRFAADGSIMGTTFDLDSRVISLEGVTVTIVDGLIPRLECAETDSGFILPSTARFGETGTTSCHLTGFQSLTVRPGTTIIFEGGKIGQPNDGSRIVVAQGATLVIRNSGTSYAHILNFGTVEFDTDARLVMVDASIENRGLWHFNNGFSFLDSASLIFTNESRFPAWFQNDEGEVNSDGFPLIGIKFNNTGGLMTTHVSSINSEAVILGDFTFTGVEQIFKQSQFRALDNVIYFDYRPYSPDPLNNNSGSYGLPFVPIVTLPEPFDPVHNGYWHPDPNYGQDGGERSVYVSYYYNGTFNQIPDRRANGDPWLPRIVVVTLDPDLPVNYTRYLTLLAGTNSLLASPFILIATMLFLMF